MKATVQQDQSHQLSASATSANDTELELAAGVRRRLGTLDSRIQSSGLSLAFLNAFSGKAIQGIGGEVEVDLQVRGSLERTHHHWVLTSARWQTYAQPLSAFRSLPSLRKALLEPRGIRISQLSARANEGRTQRQRVHRFDQIRHRKPLTFRLQPSNGRRSILNNIRLN